MINKADKGQTQYIKDALQHLNDPDTYSYRVLDDNPTIAIFVWDQLTF